MNQASIHLFPHFGSASRKCGVGTLHNKNANVRTEVWEEVRTFGGIIVAVSFCGSLPFILTF